MLQVTWYKMCLIPLKGQINKVCVQDSKWQMWYGKGDKFMGSLAFAILSAMLIIGVSPKAINFCTVLQSKIFRMNIIVLNIGDMRVMEVYVYVYNPYVYNPYLWRFYILP
jgi:hypothetical protein